MGVTLSYKLVTHNKKMSKLPRVSLFHTLSAIFLSNSNRIGLQLGKLSQK